MIKVGDRVRWDGEGYEVVLAVTSTHAFVVWTGDGGTAVQRAPLSELTLVESAPEPFRDLVDLSVVDPTPKRDAFTHALGAWKCPECDSIRAENARLREALQMALRLSNLPDEEWDVRDQEALDKAAAALGIRPKETP